MLRCLGAAFAAVIASPALASTGFHLGAGATAQQPDLYAISTGWYYPVQAAVTVNARHVEKTAELLGVPGEPLRWESRFGSVSVTMYGVGFSMSGVNEKGLMIQGTILHDKANPPVPKGAHWLTNQWIQYHLDTSATLQEVVEKSITGDALVMAWSPLKYNSQHQVCDPTGCAVFSYHDGKAVAQGTFGRIERDLATGKVTVDPKDRIDLGAVANDAPEDSQRLLAACKDKPCPALDSSGKRYVLAAKAVLRHAAEPALGAAQLMPEVFDDLKTLDQGPPLTTWNEVYTFDRATSRIQLFYKSPRRPQGDLQWIDFGAPDYDCRKPMRVWWLDMDRAGGDQTGRSVELTSAMQERLVLQHAKEKGGFLSPEQARARIGSPERWRCAGTPSTAKESTP